MSIQMSVPKPKANFSISSNPDISSIRDCVIGAELHAFALGVK